MKTLWQSGRLSDFSIIVGSKIFRVHRNWLSTQSSVLAKIFDENDQATEMKIEDFSEAAVENLLHFMYTSEIKKTVKENDAEMFSIATKLDVPDLKAFYKKVLEEKLMTCTVLEAYNIFLVAHQKKCKKMKLQAFKAIECHLRQRLLKDLLYNPDRLEAIVLSCSSVF